MKRLRISIFSILNFPLCGGNVFTLILDNKCYVIISSIFPSRTNKGHHFISILQGCIQDSNLWFLEAKGIYSSSAWNIPKSTFLDQFWNEFRLDSTKQPSFHRPNKNLLLLLENLTTQYKRIELHSPTTPS